MPHLQFIALLPRESHSGHHFPHLRLREPIAFNLCGIMRGHQPRRFAQAGEYGHVDWEIRHRLPVGLN